ncbi:MAG: hypothetical protein AAFQ80_06495 [Cyanobacteria bacterium J06621_8]
MVIKLCPNKVFIVNIFLILFLLCLNILVIVLGSNLESAPGVFLFNFNSEKNIPTLYSSAALIISSILLLFIACSQYQKKASYIPWFVLSGTFLFLSIDELFAVHEKLIKPMKEIFQASGFFYYAWVIPYGIALVIFTILYSKFLFRLPKNIMLLFLVSGATFVLGAIGFELLGGRQAQVFGEDTILYSVYYTCEEFLEMLGIATFIYALLTYVANQAEAVTIVVTKDKLK